ncbi:RNA polymerase, sigma-24 subunit, ECF subfamily [Sphingopyxis sp. LC81]|jgi:RNA polymerase sigma-70 factor (ECF subfamily)|uniref:sigma-70 family RNA polymerase sigma factor n=1 Tax=Sphingopyxis sp. LC81 TaxID=1502850 RepID=UPI00050EF77F|nr:sigma-70 family RNA polymerase sigma factor [Sphingopyxis sp. LC81]KGB55016.1 RNA polymerase, sigma-24 subunit, ECF subfamily [Sphingopyxis sp. LC81]
MTLPDMSPRFEAVCHTEHARLLRYLRRRVGPDEAPDLVQEAFARLLGARNPERIENPAAYLSRITRNMLINRARKRQRGLPVFFPLDEERTAPTAPEQTWRIEAKDLQRLYRQAVRAMPPKTRRVFVMHRVHRQSYKDIAEQVGISVATVEYHMARALTLCRTAVAGQW